MIRRTFKNIVSKLFAMASQSSKRQRCKHTFAVAAEVLEQRVLLAAGDWLTAVDGNFQDASKWDGPVPTTGTQATFNKKKDGATYKITFIADATSKLAVTANANPEFKLSGKTYTVEELKVVGIAGTDTPTLKLDGGGTGKLTSPGGTIDKGGTIELVNGALFKPTDTFPVAKYFLTVGDEKKGTLLINSGTQTDVTVHTPY